MSCLPSIFSITRKFTCFIHFFKLGNKITMTYKLFFFFLNWPLCKKFYLLPRDPDKPRFVIHTPPSPPNCELMIHVEINNSRTCTAPSE